MAKYLEAGNSLECIKSNVATRKISKNPCIIKIDGINYFKYSAQRRCIVKILEELNPKQHRIYEKSALNINDEIEAQGVDIYTEKRFKLKKESNYSNVHGIQSNIINTFTCAKIMTPFRFVLEKSIEVNYQKSLHN